MDDTHLLRLSTSRSSASADFCLLLCMKSWKDCILGCYRGAGLGSTRYISALRPPLPLLLPSGAAVGRCS